MHVYGYMNTCIIYIIYYVYLYIHGYINPLALRPQTKQPLSTPQTTHNHSLLSQQSNNTTKQATGPLPSLPLYKLRGRRVNKYTTCNRTPRAYLPRVLGSTRVADTQIVYKWSMYGSEIGELSFAEFNTALTNTRLTSFKL